MDPVFFIKSTKIGVFYQYGYTDITTFRDPCGEDALRETAWLSLLPILWQNKWLRVLKGSEEMAASK